MCSDRPLTAWLTGRVDIRVKLLCEFFYYYFHRRQKLLTPMNRLIAFVENPWRWGSSLFSTSRLHLTVFKWINEKFKLPQVNLVTALFTAHVHKDNCGQTMRSLTSRQQLTFCIFSAHHFIWESLWGLSKNLKSKINKSLHLSTVKTD